MISNLDKEKKIPWHRYSIIACLIHALLSLFFISGAGDGTWHLYAKEIHYGKKIFSDIGLSQQPLFPILHLVAINLNWSGLIGKLIFLPSLALFIYSIYHLSGFPIKNYFQRSILILFIYFGSINFVAYRFDDYNSMSYALIFASFLMAVRLEFIRKHENISLIFNFQILIITILTLLRFTDGVFIALSFLIFSLYKYGYVKFIFMKMIYGLVFYIITLALILYFVLDENFQSWINYTILKASNIKAGDGGLYLYPFEMANRAYRYLIGGRFDYISIAVILSVVYIFTVKMDNINDRNLNPWVILLPIIGVTIYYIYPTHISLTSVAFSIIVILFAFFLFIFKILGFHFFKNKNSRSIYLIYPGLLFISGSLSSGGNFGDHFMPMVLTFYSLLFMYGKRGGLRHAIIIFLLFAVLINTMTMRLARPYVWHSYNSPIFFHGYTLKKSEVHGLHVIPVELYTLIQPVCNIVGNDDLLSLPFSYANYYCGLRPWKGYVQTFFDTSSHAKIYDLISSLQLNPPRYIFYQRQLENLSAHENIFNNSKKLPHRDLDELIIDRLQSRAWNVVYRSNSFPPSEWLLIDTRKVSPLE